MTPSQVDQLISHTHQLRYQVFFLILYSMVLRFGECLKLTVHDIDAQTVQLHVCNGKDGKDRLFHLPKRTLHAIRAYLQNHHNAVPAINQLADTLTIT